MRARKRVRPELSLSHHGREIGAPNVRYEDVVELGVERALASQLSHRERAPERERE